MDDTITVSGSQEACSSSLHSIVTTCERAGFKVQHNKVVGPARKIEFLGIEIDCVNRQLQISEERMAEIRKEIGKWEEKTSCTKRQLLSIAGKLSFCATVVRDGGKFIRRLYGVAKKLKEMNSRVRINGEIRKDLRWWAKCLGSHNGIRWFPRELDVNRAKMVFTDACNTGLGGMVDSKWTFMKFEGKHEWIGAMSIAYKELLAVVVCVATFGWYLQGQDVIMNIDNKSMQEAVQRGKSKEKDIMALIRVLYFYTTIYRITYETVHVRGVDNGVADRISRARFQDLKKVAPNIDNKMTNPVDIIYNF